VKELLNMLSAESTFGEYMKAILDCFELPPMGFIWNHRTLRAWQRFDIHRLATPSTSMIKGSVVAKMPGRLFRLASISKFDMAV
jgi:hypothetical protein